MKRIYTVVLAALLISIMCVSCKTADNKTVKIAVMGDRDKFYKDYEAGIIQAIDDLNEGYAQFGYHFEYEIYNDHSRYVEGAQIADELANNDSITAVIGSLDMDINATAAYIFDNNNKLFVVPYSLYDSVYESKYYDTVLSLATSGKEIGQCFAKAVERETNAKRWAVCAADDEFSISEMRGFMRNNSLTGDIRIVDCNDILTLMSDFDNETNRWKALGVDGVVFFPGKTYTSSELFGLLSDVRAKMPGIVCMGDSNFDDSETLLSNPEFQKAMTGFISVSDFYELSEYDKSEEYEIMNQAFFEKNGRSFDLWFLQAYNMISMIGDTAVENNTTDGQRIAAILHEEGYDGMSQQFVFDYNGSQALDIIQYYVMQDDGTVKEITVR